MCLILVKPSGVNPPSELTIRKAWDNNFDGFGLAYSIKGCPKVIISKGAMKLKQAFALIKAVPNIKEAAVVMHFRFATEGRVDAGNCHPYPISKKINELRATALETPIALAHNGIIPNMKPAIYTQRGGKTIQLPRDRSADKLTDTQDFIRQYLVGMGKQALFNNKVGNLIEMYTSSKFAFLSAQKLLLLGDFIEDEGIYYSNSGYKYSNFYGTASGGWDDISLDQRSPRGTSSSWLKDDIDDIDDIGLTQKGELWECRGFWSTWGECDMCKQKDVIRWYEDVQSWVCDDCLRYFPELDSPWKTVHKAPITIDPDLPPEEMADTAGLGGIV